MILLICALLPLDLASALSAQRRSSPDSAGNVSRWSGARSGCGQAQPWSAGSFNRVEIPVGDTTRQATVFVPANYNPSTRYLMLFSFHGMGLDSWQQAKLDNFVNHTRGGAIVVYPDGLADTIVMQEPGVLYRHGLSPRSWNALGSSGSPGRLGHTCVMGRNTRQYPCLKSCGRCRDRCWWGSCANDRRFIRKLLQHLLSALCVEMSGVYGVGFSNGGMMAMELAAHPRIARAFAGLATVAGLPMHGFDRAPASATTKLLGIWGTLDRTVPMPVRGGGPAPFAVSDERYLFASPDVVVRGWARARRLALELPRAGPAPGGGPSCSGAGNLRACVWEGPHGWPPFATGLVVDYFLGRERGLHGSRSRSGALLPHLGLLLLGGAVALRAHGGW